MPRSTNAVTYIVFVLLGVSTHLAIIAAAAFFPNRSRAFLDGSLRWLQDHNRVIMIGLGLVFGGMVPRQGSTWFRHRLRSMFSGTDRISARHSVSRRDRPHRRRVDPGLAGTEAARRGRPQRGVHRPRRHRLRTPRLLRQPDLHAEHRRPGRRRPDLRQHEHHRAVLAVAVVHPQRAQPPLESPGLPHQRVDGLPGLRRLHPVRERLPLRNPSGTGLQHLLRRQVAPGPRGVDDRGRPV